MKNIYEVFSEHIREHIKNNDEINLEILNNPLSGICPFCEQTMYQVYKTETGQNWKVDMEEEKLRDLILRRL